MTIRVETEKGNFRQLYLFYIFTVFITSACGLIIEITAGRMLAPYLGMSIYTWTAIIAVVLAGFSVGHIIGGYLAERPADRAERAMVPVLLAASVSAAASLVLIRLLADPLLNADLTPLATIIIFTIALFFLPSLFVGIPSPVLTKLAIEEDRQRTGRTLGGMYAAGAIGSIIGTLAAGYIFISWLGTINTVLAVSATYFLLALIFFIRTPGADNRTGIWSIALTILILAIMWGTGTKVLAFTSACTKESQYYCIRIIDTPTPGRGAARLMVLDHLAHGVNLKTEPLVLQHSYVELQDQLLRAHMKNRPNLSAYFVGGGANTLPRAWHHRFRDARITISEIDPEVTELARTQMWLDTSDRLEIIHGDARNILRSRPGTFDVIVGDAFHDIAVPQHLITLEFFQLIRKRLNENGIYVMNVVDHLGHPKLVLSVVKTLKQLFPVVEIWLDDDQVRTGGRITFVLIAAQNPSPRSKLKSIDFPDRHWQRIPENLVASMNKRVQPILLTDDFAPVDRLLTAE